MADILLVHHPFSGRRPRRAETDALRRRLAGDGHAVDVLATIAAPAFVELLRERLEAGRPDVVVAAGGDGTVRDVAEALLALPDARRPSLVLVARGTANNAARAIDPAMPVGSDDVADRVAATLAGGPGRRVDAGRANGRAFVGSLAVGMDADILAWRNAASRRVPAAVAGYPLYLASCAVNALRRHGGPVRLHLSTTPGDVDWVVEERVVNVLVTNTALYAGEFRFAGGGRHEDGRLDLLWNRSMGDYLRRYAAAWPRHLRVSRGLDVHDDAGVTPVVRVRMDWPAPMAWQLDGEEMPPSARFDIEVLPAALTLLVAAAR